MEQYKIPIVARILPLPSFRNAEFLHNEVPGMSIPQEIRDRLEKAVDSDEAWQIGIEIAQDMLIQIKDKVQGVYLMPPFGRYLVALEVLEVL
ncbi:MAG: methylenetetrahydrofolate reductase [bacterium]|nr:MAG: methylenetetrahydrofolate reductase [bacterium]